MLLNLRRWFWSFFCIAILSLPIGSGWFSVPSVQASSGRLTENELAREVAKRSARIAKLELIQAEEEKTHHYTRLFSGTTLGYPLKSANFLDPAPSPVYRTCQLFTDDCFYGPSLIFDRARGYHMAGSAFARIVAPFALAANLVAGPVSADPSFVTSLYKDKTAPIEARISDLIPRMTLAEKIQMLSGTGFETRPIARLGIPPLNMADGPLGVRFGKNTAFPSGISYGASFDPALIYNVSKAMALETRARGRDLLLGPCINISRNPFGGRNFESFGEDPFLTSQLAVSYVRGLQENQVMASTKHYALNNQEFERMSIDVRIDERTMQEIYFPAFHAAVKAGSWSVMASYNKVNGHWAAENDFMLNQILKKEWGFQGFVVSDWEATHSTVKSALAGLDLEMPVGVYFSDALYSAVLKGQVSESLIDDKVRRIFRAMFSMGLFDGANDVRPDLSVVNSPAHRALALRLAQESIVLLKNEGGVLPINTDRARKIALIGPNALTNRTGGGGSSEVTPFQTISPIQGFKERLAGRAQIEAAVAARLPGDFDAIPSALLSPADGSRRQGLTAEYYPNTTFTGPPMLTRIEKNLDFQWGLSGPDVGLPENEFSARLTGYITPDRSGEFDFAVISDDGVRVSIDGEEIINNWSNHGPELRTHRMRLEAGRSYHVRIEYYEYGGGAVLRFGWLSPAEAEFERAVTLARSSDVAVVFAGLSNTVESEGFDRTTMDLPPGQEELISAVAAVNPNTIVVLNAGNPVSMTRWISRVKAVIYAWYPGQEGGYALADVVLGAVNPSGKLPITLMKKWEDSPAYGNYPGNAGAVNYSEGIYVGYRHYDTRGVEPLFAFGHGLSYTTFTVDGVQTNVRDASSRSPEVDVSFVVTNTGSRAGAEVAQIYVSEKNPVVDRPLQELKGFRKVWLNPGESAFVSVRLDASAFSYFDSKTRSWKVQPGAFEIRVGTSSRDLRAFKRIELR